MNVQLPEYTLFICHHVHGRTYRADDALCQVCPRCLAVRSTDEGRWPPEQRLLHPDGRMTDQAGRELHDDWRAVLRREEGRA